MLVELEDDGALNIPPGARNFTVSDDFVLPMDVEVLAIYPHAHYLGRLLEAYATLPSGCRKPLIRIQDWDRNWEAVYRYRDPVFQRAKRVHHFDEFPLRQFVRESAQSQPSRQACASGEHHGGRNGTPVVTGSAEGSARPACGSWKKRCFAIVWENYPSDYEAHLHLGATRLARLDPSGAASELQKAVRGAPMNPEAHNMLGSAMVALGRNAEAVDQFRAALKLRPEYPNARYNLARALIKSGRLPEATDLYRQVIAAYPDDAQAHAGLGELLFRQRKFEEALQEFDRALALDPAFEAAKRDQRAGARRSQY